MNVALNASIGWIVAWGSLASVAACSHAQADVPLLRLAPAALGTSLLLTQQLDLRREGHEATLDAALEVDERAVRLAVQMLGQTAVRLRWDGTALSETRASWVPAHMSGARILSDLQYVLWPAQAIRAALPAGCQITDMPLARRLCCDGTLLLRIRYDQAPPRIHQAILENLRHHYELWVETAPS